MDKHEEKKRLAGQERYTMDDLLAIVALLRDPDDGCPWDKEQTHRSIRKNFIEETYEVADAIDLGDSHLLCEELGDVLLQVALHTRMETEQGVFTFEDVCTGICRKLILRHPHIFADTDAHTSGEVLRNWEEIKRHEKKRESAADDLASVPAALPALMRAQKLTKRAAAHGCGRDSADEALCALEESVAALRRAVREKGDTGTLQENLGELFLCAADTARLLGCDAEESLTEASARFAARVSESGEQTQ